ncbi:hypothetical protein PR048_008579 [Dryococelus australis]|uniref:DDE-1 domain-containing protein n=1 Tax=Dryococelus australis TaxID=614101 RepID=A0ABQ9HXL0_9NEOP|nr:hypothetical protein PR048_008579 [Dryococelus australis]
MCISIAKQPICNTGSPIPTIKQWLLRNFKAKHSIRELDLSGEKLSADPKAAENFIENFKIEGKLVLLAIQINQPKAWMTAALFTKWYDSIVRPEVKKYQKAIGKEGSKVMLILDNAPTPQKAFLIEKMDVSKHSPCCQTKLLRKLLIEDENEQGIVAHHQNLDLKDCSYMVVEAWNLVKKTTLKKSFEQIERHFKQGGTERERKMKKKKCEKEEEESEAEEDEMTLEDLRKILLKIPGCSESSAEDVGKWFACDSLDPGFQIRSDDELIQSVREETDDQKDDIATESNVGPSAGEVFACLDTTLTWMERQPECDHKQLLTVKRMQDLAA